MVSNRCKMAVREELTQLADFSILKLVKRFFCVKYMLNLRLFLESKKFKNLKISIL
jgi:hypothetical protein